jgi:hypothetical protein
VTKGRASSLITGFIFRILYISRYIKTGGKTDDFWRIKGQSADYQTGHNTGTVRALVICNSDSESWNRSIRINDTQCREICQIADSIRADWEHHCDTFGMGIDDDRLEPLICRRVSYVMKDEPYTTYTGTVERDSNGAPVYTGRTDAGAMVYDTGALLTVTEIE